MFSIVNICVHSKRAVRLHLTWGVISMNSNQLDPVLVGEAIAIVRKGKGKTQEVISGLADIGRTHLSAIERGERKPTLETLWRLATAMDMSPCELVAEIEHYVAEHSKERNH